MVNLEQLTFEQKPFVPPMLAREESPESSEASVPAAEPAPNLHSPVTQPTSHSDDVEADDIRRLPLEGFLNGRQAALIANFVGGFAAGWFIPVPESFKDALDIKLTPRKFNKLDEKGERISIMVRVNDKEGNDKKDKDGNVRIREDYQTVTENFWTQGQLFSFSPGDVFYDTREAYGDAVWLEDSKKVGVCIQVREASSSKVEVTKTWETVTPVPMFENRSKSEGRDKEPQKNKREQTILYDVAYTRSAITYGKVCLAFLIPVDGRLIECGTLETNQELFVRFLQTGLLRCEDGKTHDFTGGFPKTLAQPYKKPVAGAGLLQ